MEIREKFLNLFTENSKFRDEIRKASPEEKVKKLKNAEYTQSTISSMKDSFDMNLQHNKVSTSCCQCKSNCTACGGHCKQCNCNCGS